MVSNTCCVVFFFVLCTLCCQFLWVVLFLLPHRYYVTFIYVLPHIHDDHVITKSTYMTLYSKICLRNINNWFKKTISQFTLYNLQIAYFSDNEKYYYLDKCIDFVWFMMFNATFKNSSAISWRSVLLVEESGVQTLSHNVVSSAPRHERGSNSQL
jgi:hypothetical protein